VPPLASGNMFRRRPRDMFRRPPIVMATTAVLMAILMMQPASATTESTARAKVLHFVNQYRHQHGLGYLREDGDVDRMSHRHSTAMADARTLFHSTNLLVKLRTKDPTRWGENIGYGPRLWGLFRAFVRSAPHRHNLLGQFRSTGIGVVRRNGCAWLTMIFYS
jgi:uncharacterized protein YkwD